MTESGYKLACDYYNAVQSEWKKPFSACKPKEQTIYLSRAIEERDLLEKANTERIKLKMNCLAAFMSSSVPFPELFPDVCFRSHWWQFWKLKDTRSK